MPTLWLIDQKNNDWRLRKNNKLKISLKVKVGRWTK